MLAPMAPSLAQEGGRDVTAELQREIDAATRIGRPFPVPAGPLYTTGLRLADGARLIGVRGGAHLVLLGDGPLIKCDGAAHITISGIVFDGADRKLGTDLGLVDFSSIEDLSLSDCVVEHSGGIGLRLRSCGGWVQRNHVRDIGGGGIFSTHATGLIVADNSVERCGDNGIQIWRANGGDDGTRVSGNRVSDIGNASGGTGQYGNGISIFRAGGVTVEGNTVRRCAYSAVRNNGGAGVIISANNCAELGEVAIYAEFDFEGCVIANNTIDGAGSGVHIANFADQNGHAAVCSGNIIRHVRPTKDHGGHEYGYECGITAEADVTITGNVIEGAPWVGILVGWGPSLRDVTVTGNVVRDAPIGIAVSVVDGAGAAVIADNIIAGASAGAVVGMRWDKPSTGDLARDAAGAPARLRISGNQAS
jgi:uncharacterized secreted repeat protein (TIGR03808 family)